MQARFKRQSSSRKGSFARQSAIAISSVTIERFFRFKAVRRRAHAEKNANLLSILSLSGNVRFNKRLFAAKP
jgi:hypothetical protein